MSWFIPQPKTEGDSGHTLTVFSSIQPANVQSLCLKSNRVSSSNSVDWCVTWFCWTEVINADAAVLWSYEIRNVKKEKLPVSDLYSNEEEFYIAKGLLDILKP